MTGIFSSQMIGQSAHSFFSSILQQEEYKTFEPVLADALRGQASFIPPITLTERNNSHVIVIPAISYITGDDDTKPTGIIITLKDISAFRESQDLLKKNELKYRELVENANSIIIRVSPNYKITFFNEYAQKFFGYTEAEVLGKNVVGIIVPETDSDGHDLQEMVRDIMSIPEDHESIENENVCKNGTRVWVHWANRAVRDREGNLVEVLSVGTDITEKKKTQQAIQTYEAELRSLSSELTLSEERARRQLAGALHDTVGQTLALTKLKLGSLGRLVKGKEAKRRLTEIREMFEGSIHQIRTMSFELSSPILYELGLGDAIEWLGETLGKRYAFTVCFQGPEKPCTVTEAVKIFFFQVARELLINIAKHAEATKVNLSLVEANGWLIMQIVDDGKGINPEDCKGGLSKKNRFGLFSIRERTKHMGGTFEIQSEEKGTIAIVSAPIERAKVISG
jgi:PAS domain S-box-containing protein